MRCFVMMPYGKNEDEQKEYSRIYKLLIKSAAEECGLECIRSDIEGKGGHVLGNVIQSLAEDDIAIADISGLNWNVAYELGMRHVLRKNGTILICNDETELPFDIQSLNIFIYPANWLDQMEEICDKLKSIIDNRISGVTQNDSPVHEKYSFLPDEVIKSHADTTDDAVKKAKERISVLEKELSDVYEKIESMGLTLKEGHSAKIDYTKSFLRELNNSIYISDNAVAKLRELLDSGEKEGFLEFLGKVLSVGFLDEHDCRTVYFFCRKLGIPAITRTYLEAVTSFYPQNDELMGFLANAYSQNYHTGDKAVQMVNSIIGVSLKDGKYQLLDSTQVTNVKLGSFFNVYNHLKKYNELIEIGKLLIDKYAANEKIVSMTARNMTSAAISLDQLDLAAEYKWIMLNANPDDDQSHYVCAKYESAIKNHPGAIEEMEKCIFIDSSDIDYYIWMAGYICDYGYARDPKTKEMVKVPSAELDMYAVPFMLAALRTDVQQYTRVFDFLRRNKFAKYIEPLTQALKAGSLDFAKVFPDLDFGAVGYCKN